MSVVPMLNEAHLQAIAEVLDDALTGTELSNMLEICRIQDTSGESTKWKRIYKSLLDRQRQDRCGNNVVAFIKAVMSPGRYINARECFESLRQSLNAVLLFDGLELDTKGELHQVAKATTIDEAQERALLLMRRLKGRSIHPTVLTFCRAELLHDNYFHAVFEASKSLAERVRGMTGLHTDGAELFDEAFSLKKPLLAFNSLGTITERTEQTGFAMLLKGCYSAIRSPLAHEAKILWQIGDDAADYLTLISLLHRKLDDAIVVPQPAQNT